MWLNEIHSLEKLTTLLKTLVELKIEAKKLCLGFKGIKLKKYFRGCCNTTQFGGPKA